MCQGYISIHRKLREHWIYEEKRIFSKFEAWIDILYEVNHQDNKFLLGSELVEVKRGSTITSLRKLSEKWSWSITKVSSFLNLLELDKMLVVKKDTKKTRLTVVNYDFYQSDKWKKEHRKDTEVTPKEHKKDTKVTRKETNNNDNNDLIMDNNEEEDNNKIDVDLFFSECWKLYPNKQGKGNISDTNKKKLFKLNDEFKRCIDRYIKYVEHRQKTDFADLKFKNGSTFFNSGYVDFLDKNYEELKVKPKTLDEILGDV